jgi:hypothetical protein
MRAVEVVVIAVIVVAFVLVLSKTSMGDYFANLDPDQNSAFGFVNMILPVGSNGQDEECKPGLPQEQTLILRLDGVQAFEHGDIVTKIVDEILARDMSVTLGVVPQDIGSDEKIKAYIQEKAGDSRVEIAQYGTTLQTGNESETYAAVNDGREVLAQTFGFSPTTYISPENEYGDVQQALSDSGFSVISAGNGEYRFDGEMLYVGHTVSTSAAQASGSGKNLADEMMSKCLDSLNRMNVCVVSLNPRDFAAAGNGALDEERYSEFVELLAGLRMAGVKTANLNDLAAC